MSSELRSRQFTIANAWVDLSRNQITLHGHTQTLPPKAMGVLAQLIQYQGQVVSQDELLDGVWQDAVVMPNTLQQAIAQLRKALGDNGAHQALIKTHAKRGYSLEQAAVPAEKPKDKNKSQFFMLLSLVMILAIGGFLLFPSVNHTAISPGKFGNPVPVTATDGKEAGASYSPDGRYIVFHRFGSGCDTHIFAKNVATGEETQLTREFGVYSNHSFSPDGKQIVFTARESCGVPNQDRTCWNLMSLPFDAALASPQMPALKISCDAAEITDPLWLNNNKIALLQKVGQRNALVSYLPDTVKAQTLYAPQDLYLYGLNYSKGLNQLSVMAIDNVGQHYLQLLSPDGQLLRSSQLQRPDGMSKHKQLYPDFVPGTEHMLFSYGRRLYRLGYDGTIAPYSDQMNSNIYQPSVHPGSHKLVAPLGKTDDDIAILTPNSSVTLVQHLDSSRALYPSLERSNSIERNAQFRPGSDTHIGYVSARSGNEQLWLYDGVSSHQLTRFSGDNEISDWQWHENGDAILMVNNGQLLQWEVDGTTQVIPLDFSVQSLYQWQKDQVLIMARLNTGLTLINYQLDSGKYKTYPTQALADATLTAEGILFYSDINRRFWQLDGAGVKEITGLKGNRQFIQHQNRLYGINIKGELWQYQPQTGTYQVLHQLEAYGNYLTDIADDQWLITQRVSIKKDIVEMSLIESN